MNDRKINKGEMHVNLHTTPLFITAVKTDNMGRKSYERYSNNKINTRSIHSIIMLQLLVDFIQKNMINLRKEGDDMKLYSKEVHNFLVKDKII